MRGARRSSDQSGRPVDHHDDDGPLVSRARDGDRAAFEELVRRHADRVYAVVLRFGAPHGDAEEIVQETFVRAWRGIGRFEGDSQFFTWLYRIAINEAKRHMTRRGAELERVASDEIALEAIGDPAPGPQLRAEHRDLRAALERAVRALPLDHRIPLVLRDIEGLSTEQAAGAMQLGEAAFKSRLHRARLAVRDAMDDYLDVEDTA